MAHGDTGLLSPRPPLHPWVLNTKTARLVPAGPSLQQPSDGAEQARAAGSKSDWQLTVA